MKLFKTLRNHWKKSVFFSLVSVYGGRWAWRRSEDEALRREFCMAAAEFGNEPVAPFGRLRHVTVFLNPAAGDHSSKSLFEKNVAPLLQLGGLDVRIVKTEFEGQARGYMEVVEKGSTDAVILVGGSGLVVEAVTGLLRRPDAVDITNSLPIGIIPTGKSSTLALALMSPVLPRRPVLGDVRFMGEAAMAILRGKTTKVDALKIEPDRVENQENSESEEKPKTPTKPKTIYAVAGLDWGLHRDVAEKRDKYWYWGKLRHQAAYFFSIASLFDPWPKSVGADLEYVEACDGCSKCFVKEEDIRAEQVAKEIHQRSLFQRLFAPVKPSTVAAKEPEPVLDRSSVINHSCGQRKTARLRDAAECVAVLDSVATPTAFDAPGKRHDAAIRLETRPAPSTRRGFVAEGWRRLKEAPLTGFFLSDAGSWASFNENNSTSISVSDSTPSFSARVREFYLNPTGVTEGQFWSIDDELFEVTPMKVSLLRNSLTCFTAH